MRGRSAVARAYRLIYEASPHLNTPTPDRPYILVVYSGGFQTAFITVGHTDGYNPVRNRARQLGWQTGKKYWRTYVGGPKSQFQKALPEMIAYRDSMNLIHQLRERKAKITSEDVERMKAYPEMLTKLSEAACLAAV